METKTINDLGYPSTCQLCDNSFRNGPWYVGALCPNCKNRLMGLLDAASLGVLNYDTSADIKLKEEPKSFKGLNEMTKAIYEGNKAKGFWDNERNVGETLMLVVTELAEAMEAHRKGNTAPPTLNMPEVSRDNFEMFFKDTFEDEVADAVIRILDLCGGWGIDLEWHVREKVKYNAGRERLHGKQY